MATAAPVKPIVNEPFHDRRSDLFGTVLLYAPDGDPSTWKDRAWTVTTERGPDGPLKAHVKAEFALIALMRTHFIPLYKEWHYGDEIKML